MVKIFLTSPIDHSDIFPLFFSYYGITKQEKGSLFVSDIYKKFDYSNLNIFDIVRSVAEADFVIIPHNIRALNDRYRSYVKEQLAFARSHHKELLVFVCGDLTHDVFIPGAIVLKNLPYRYLLQPNEIIIPTYVEDLSASSPLVPRKKRQKPVVGFCGWGDFGTMSDLLKAQLKTLPLYAQAIFGINSYAIAHKKGVLFRREAIKSLRLSSDIEANFIVRKSFSANAKLIEVDPAQARKDFINNIIDSDFTLVIKGDGNNANRLYETLSLGRIPVLVDTEIVLPLESKIDYSEFMLKASYKEIPHLGKIIGDFYNTLSEERFISMQQKARIAFEKYLRIDSFFKELFKSPETVRSLVS